MNKNTAIDLAVKYLLQKRREFAASADADRYGFRFGVLAREKWDKITETIEILEGLKDEL